MLESINEKLMIKFLGCGLITLPPPDQKNPLDARLKTPRQNDLLETPAYIMTRAQQTDTTNWLQNDVTHLTMILLTRETRKIKHTTQLNSTTDLPP
jgi:hypothetical protein